LIQISNPEYHESISSVAGLEGIAEYIFTGSLKPQLNSNPKPAYLPPFNIQNTEGNRDTNLLTLASVNDRRIRVSLSMTDRIKP